jgi:glycosyltransferase involved in cell wall biosynthesis
MSATVAHFTRKYGVTGENYICDQVALPTRYRGKLFAERRISSSFNPIPDAQCYLTIPEGRFLTRAVEGILNRFAYRLYEAQLNRFYAEQVFALRPAILHAHFGTTACKLLPLKAQANLPLVVTFYGNDISEVLQSPFWVARYKKLFQGADRLIVLFEDGVKRLEALGCPTAKISIWDIGIPTNEYSYRERDFSLPTLQILTAARFVHKKGYPVLLQAFAQLHRRRSNLRLKILGNGPLKSAIVEQIANLGLHEAVTLIDTSKRSDFFELFKEALVESHIFVAPSIVAPNGDDEGGPPVVITNAMASGVPIVATAVGGITRAIVHEHTGLISLSGDAVSLADSIERLIVNPMWSLELARNARLKSENTFDLSRQIQKLESIYDNVLAEHRARH